MTIAAGQVTPEQRKRRRATAWRAGRGRSSACCCRSRLAVLWEFAVRAGLASGRLVPPPSVIFATFGELAQTGELQRHALATCLRVAAGFGIGVVAGTLGRRHHRLFRADPAAARSDLAGAARDPLDRLGAAVRALVRHFRGLEDHADRGRRVLSGLSRRHGRDHVGRPQARRGRPRVPPVRRRHGPAHSACRRCCRPMCFRCARGLGSAGCSSSPPNCSAPRRGSAIS